MQWHLVCVLATESERVTRAAGDAVNRVYFPVVPQVAWSGGVEVGRERRCVRHLPPGLRRLLSRLHCAWR